MMGENKKYYLIFAIITFSAAVMIAHGARMMFQGIFKPNSYYPAPTPTTIDFWFDWTILLILGIIVFSLALSTFYRNFSKNKNKKVEDKPFFNPS